MVSAPSGAGKTTLCAAIRKCLADIEVSVSHTTRAPRGKERDGVDYHFVDDATFAELADQDAFLEWANVHGKSYGTSRKKVEERLAAGVDVLFDIDVQGGRQLRDKLDDVVLVFVLPPDMAALEQRLRGRRSDSEAQIQARLQAATEEIEAAGFYTYWFVNDDLDEAVETLRTIIVAERLRRADKQALIEELTGSKT